MDIVQAIECTHICDGYETTIFGLEVETSRLGLTRVLLCQGCYDQLKGAVLQAVINEAFKGAVKGSSKRILRR